MELPVDDLDLDDEPATMPLPSLQMICIEQIARDVRYHIAMPLPSEWHDKLYHMLAKSGRLTPDAMLPLLRSRDHGEALGDELGERMSQMALSSVGLRALAAARLTHRHTPANQTRKPSEPFGTSKPELYCE
mmetsp:Transcript_15051/g.39079  ORF Transcript_15051/g.39079 Transcript_15051/m.39079 type:complete len:132 (+) Transcript_15051:44-439(+)